MRVSAKSNADAVLRDLDAHVSMIKAQAMPATINELIDRSETAGLRAVAKEYGIPQGQFRKYLRKRKTGTGARSVEASVSAFGIALPLYLFQPRQTKRGVSVKVKQKRFVIPHTFIARMRSGRIGVFARGAYGAKGLVGVSLTGESFGRFVFAKGRRRRSSKNTLPINELYTFGPAEAWNNEIVIVAMSDKADEDFGKVLKQQIRRFSSR